MKISHLHGRLWSCRGRCWCSTIWWTTVSIPRVSGDTAGRCGAPRSRPANSPFRWNGSQPKIENASPLYIHGNPFLEYLYKLSCKKNEKRLLLHIETRDVSKLSFWNLHPKRRAGSEWLASCRDTAGDTDETRPPRCDGRGIWNEQGIIGCSNYANSG